MRLMTPAQGETDNLLDAARRRMDNARGVMEKARAANIDISNRESESRMDTNPDNLLMLQVKAGDLDKLGILFERYKMPLYRYFYLRMGDVAASEDLVQNVFMRIIRYRERFKPVGQFKSWMFSIAHNLGIDHQRKRGRHVTLDDTRGNEHIESRTAEKDLLDCERLALLEKALQRLRGDYREVLVLSRYRELKYHEIGEILGCSEGAVKTRIHRALKELKNLYQELE